MIKELNNLKVRAIAVGLYNWGFKYSVIGNDLCCSHPNDSILTDVPVLKLPPGEWQILGRANELNSDQILSVYEYKSMFAPLQFCWNSILKENGLTNELILIHPTNSR